ncbi:MAG: hypothetical protein ACOC9Z_03690 [Chloroflexota bacterium]
MQARIARYVGRQGVLALLLLLLAACNALQGPYEETFDDAGQWGTGEDLEASGEVTGGRYEFLVNANLGLFWATAGERRSDGVYQVEATQLEGPLDNGYGMMFRVDSDNDAFYLFEVSGDGYVWIGLCENSCEEEQPLVGNGWVSSEAVNQGLDATNVLRVRAEGGNMIFFVNDQEVGRVTDNTLSRGDIGIMVETLGQGGVLVAFDNFTVTPLSG